MQGRLFRKGKVHVMDLYYIANPPVLFLDLGYLEKL